MSARDRRPRLSQAGLDADAEALHSGPQAFGSTRGHGGDSRQVHHAGTPISAAVPAGRKNKVPVRPLDRALPFPPKQMFDCLAMSRQYDAGIALLKAYVTGH